MMCLRTSTISSAVTIMVNSEARLRARRSAALWYLRVYVLRTRMWRANTKKHLMTTWLVFLRFATKKKRERRLPSSVHDAEFKPVNSLEDLLLVHAPVQIIRGSALASCRNRQVGAKIGLNFYSFACFA